MSNLIISEAYLKDYSNINKNVDMTILTPALQDAQDLYIHPLLGTKLFTEIITQVGTNTVSSLNKTLLDNYVIPCLMHYAKMESLPDMKYRLMNKGVMIKNSENSTAADLQEIQYLMDREKNKAEVFAERTTKYLRKNNASYTLYYQNVNYDEIKPNRSNISSGIYVGGDHYYNTRKGVSDCDIILGNYE